MIACVLNWILFQESDVWALHTVWGPEMFLKRALTVWEHHVLFNKPISTYFSKTAAKYTNICLIWCFKLAISFYPSWSNDPSFVMLWRSLFMSENIIFNIRCAEKLNWKGTLTNVEWLSWRGAQKKPKICKRIMTTKLKKYFCKKNNCTNWLQADIMGCRRLEGLHLARR